MGENEEDGVGEGDRGREERMPECLSANPTFMDICRFSEFIALHLVDNRKRSPFRFSELIAFLITIEPNMGVEAFDSDGCQN